MSDKIATKPGGDTRWNRILYGFWRQLIGTSLRLYTRGTVEGQSNLPEGAFMYVGTLDDARAKAEKMAAAV